VVDDHSLDDFLVEATIFSVPFGAFSIETGFINISPPNLLIIMTVAYYATATILQERLCISKLQMYILTLLSVAIAMISVTLFVQDGSPRRLVTYIGFLLLTAILFLHVESISDIERILRVAFLSAVVVSILTVVHSVTYPVGMPLGQPYLGKSRVAGVTFPFQRTLWLPISYSGFGKVLMVGTPYYFYVGLKKRSGIILFGVSLVLFAVLISQSRSTWAASGLAVVIIISGYIIDEYGRKAHIAYLLGMLLSAILLLPTIINTLLIIRPDTFSYRIEQYRVAIDLLQSNPVVGIGLGNVDEFYSAASIHSEFLRIGAEAGAVVLVIIVVIWLISALSVAKGMFSSSTKYAVCVGILASIGVMIVESNMGPGFGKASWIVLAIGLGIYSAD
jgi:hypothetical protein